MTPKNLKAHHQPLTNFAKLFILDVCGGPWYTTLLLYKNLIKSTGFPTPGIGRKLNVHKTFRRHPGLLFNPGILLIKYNVFQINVFHLYSVDSGTAYSGIIIYFLSTQYTLINLP